MYMETLHISLDNIIISDYLAFLQNSNCILS